ncbi:MAG: MCE family protein [Candidatus Dormibacteraeota bacterium]|nr:MCE family protein [Candidatus Dormibacteraeota bacterium]
MNVTRRVAEGLASARGMFVIALLAGSLTGTAFLGVGESGHTVTAQFADADGLVGGNEVRIAGVVAGSVDSVVVSNDPSSGTQFATVQFTVDGSHWPLTQGTQVAVKPKGVLSNVYLWVQPGPADAPALGANPIFPLSQTQSPVKLSELNNVFTPSVTEAIRTQLQEGVLALGGAGAPDLNQTINYADPLTRDTIPVAQVLADRTPQLNDLNFEFDTVSGDLAREDANLRPLIANLDITLGVLAKREADVQGILVNGAAAFSELSTALQYQDASGFTAIEGLQNILTESAGALSCAQALGNGLSPIISSVNPNVANLDVLLGEFITATGYYNDQNNVDTLRVNAYLANGGSENGGITAEHQTFGNTDPAIHVWDFSATNNSQLSGGCRLVNGSDAGAGAP